MNDDGAGPALRIGQLARASGLGVSALRFYDGAGVLVPARVDPTTGYRSYAPDQVDQARLVAALRRARMPLAALRAVLAVRDDPTAAADLLDRHRSRLVDALAAAQAELSSAHRLLTEPRSTAVPPALLEVSVPEPTTATLPGPALAAALAAVRYAVADPPPAEFPVLGGVLLELGPDEVTLAATDRYRLAVATAPTAELAGPPTEVVVDVALLDRAPVADVLELTVDGDRLVLSGGGIEVSGPLLPETFPDHRALLPDTGTPIPVDPGFRGQIAARPGRPAPDGGSGEVVVLDDGGEPVGVNRAFLLQALDAAAGPGQLTLDVRGPLEPLILRGPGTLSMLMPVRL